MASGSNIVYIGPWGGPGGEPWPPFHTNGGKINSIIITSNGSTINSLEFGYTDKDGNTHRAGPFGTPLTSCIVFEFEENEDLTEISGTFGMWCNMKVIKSLAFTTSKNKVYGPVGDKSGTAFSLPVNGALFDGFFGRSGDVIDAFGAILRV